MKKGIKLRLIIPLLVLIAAIFVVFIFLLNMRLRSISQREIVSTVDTVGDVSVQLVRSPLFYADYMGLRNTITPMVAADFDFFLVFDLIAGNVAFIQDKAGVLPEDYSKKFVAAERYKAKERSLVRLGGRTYHEFVFPAFITNVKSPIGLVVIGISDKTIKAKLFPITLWTLAMGVATILFVLCAVYLIANRFIVPLQRLTLAMTDYSGGDHAVRSDVVSSDEIGLLSRTFNQMANKINDQIASIETYSRDLEKMVEERSRKLVEALDELRDREAKLEQARRIRSLNDLVSAITHQINNPMAIISGHVQMIEAENRDERTAQRLKSIQNSIDRIDGLIRDITYYLSLPDIPLESRPIRGLIKEICSSLVPDSIRLTYEGFDSPVVPVVHSNELLGIAFKNVLLNAVEILEGKDGEKRITVGLHVEPAHLRLEIVDNGPGIANAERAFEPFFTDAPGRSGLGLPLAYQIMQIQNGEIAIFNTGSGTRVTLRLPISSPPPG